MGNFVAIMEDLHVAQKHKLDYYCNGVSTQMLRVLTQSERIGQKSLEITANILGGF